MTVVSAQGKALRDPAPVQTALGHLDPCQLSTEPGVHCSRGGIGCPLKHNTILDAAERVRQVVLRGDLASRSSSEDGLDWKALREL